MAPEKEKSKILVIDDDMGPRESLRYLFNKDYDVYCADSVNEGVRILKKTGPETVVLDIRMPGKDGIQGLKEIRSIDPHVSVIILTAFGALETAQQALRLGANDYIQKPFKVKEVRRVVRRFISKTRLERRQKETLQYLQKLNEQLTASMAETQRMARLGESSVELLHDIRNPLTSVVGYIELLTEQLKRRRGRLGKESRETFEFLDVIETNVKRCQELSATWKDAIKGKVRDKEVTAISKILKEITLGNKPMAESRGVALTCRSGDEELMVLAFPIQLVRALQNIVVNALHATEEVGGAVTITCNRRGKEAHIIVRDDGCGIDEEDLAHLFRPYYTTKEEGKGTGLGLYISRKIIEDCGGTLHIENAVGEGTSVRIMLPLVSAL